MLRNKSGMSPLLLLFLFSFGILNAQDVEDIMPTLSASSSFDYVKTEWNMKGKLQMYLYDGVNNLKEGDVDKAEESFRLAIEEDKTYWMGHYYLGVCYKLKELLPEARNQFELSIKYNSGDRLSYLELGKLAMIKKDKVQARKYFEEAQRLFPNYPEAYTWLGVLELNRGSIFAAKRLFKTSISTDSLYFDALFGLGMTQVFFKEKLEAMIPYMNTILSRDSTHEAAILMRAVINEQKKPELALTDYSKLIKLKPSNMNYRYGRGRMYGRISEYNKAYVDFSKYLDAIRSDENNFKGQQTRLDKKIDLQYAMYYVSRTVYGLEAHHANAVRKAFCLMLLHKYEEAMGILKLFPGYENSSVHIYLLAIANEHTDNHLEAFKLYDKALSLDPELVDAYKKRGIYLTNLSKWKEAEDDFNTAIKLNDKYWPVYKFRAICRFHQARYPDAITDFTKYLSNDSTDGTANESLVITYFQMGQYKKAMELFAFRESCYRKTKTFTHLYNALMEKGDTTFAIGKLEEIIERDRNANREYQVLRAETYAAMKAWRELLAFSEKTLESIEEEELFSSYDDYMKTMKAFALFHLQEFAKAETLFQEVKQQHPYYGFLYLQWAKCHLAKGDMKEAKKNLKKAQEYGEPEAGALMANLK